MKFDQSEVALLAAEHERYLDRMIPIIRQRLRTRTVSTEHIERYLSELPREHFRIALRRALEAPR